MKSALIRISVVVVVAIVVLVVLRQLGLSSNQKMLNEGMSNAEGEEEESVGASMPMGQNSVPESTMSGDNLMGAGTQSMMSAGAQAGVESMRNQNCFPKEQLTPAELLPQDNSSAWAQVNPAGTGTLKDRNFLQSGHHIGINTVGQTLRNANLQLRSEPPNPQVKVSPWIQSTIDPDTNRKPMEIGGCA
jgi:hypothetical protein